MRNFVSEIKLLPYSILFRLFSIIFLLICFTSCSKIINTVFYNDKLSQPLAVQVVREAPYEANDPQFLPQIDTVMKSIFNSKNIRLGDAPSRYILHIQKVKYKIDKIDEEVIDRNGERTGQYGKRLEILLHFEGFIKDTLTQKEKKLIFHLEDIKPVVSDLFFDFFAVDSEGSIPNHKPLKNCFIGVSNRVVKFIQKEK